jgi:hypothetical protein
MKSVGKVTQLPTPRNKTVMLRDLLNTTAFHRVLRNVPLNGYTFHNLSIYSNDCEAVKREAVPGSYLSTTPC